MYELSTKYISKEPKFVYTINHERYNKYDSFIVGFCSNKIHIGYLTQKDIAEHQCLKRKCPCLKMLPYREFFWDTYIEKQNIKKEKTEKKKESLKKKKEFEEEQKLRWINLIAKSNQWIKEKGLSEVLEIVNMRFDKENNRVNAIYVSDRRLFDEEFSDIFSFLRTQTGKYKLYITRAKNIDGEYATIEDWHNNPRYKETLQERACKIE